MKIVIIGAGSGFGSRISMDILSREPLQDVTIALNDVNWQKLETVKNYIRQVIDYNKLGAKVIADTDRRKLLAGADVIFMAVSIGGPAYCGKPYEYEIEIPKKYGILQHVGDTFGAGVVFRFLRSAP